MKEQLLNYLTSNTGALTMQDVVLNFLAASMIAILIYVTYKISHSGPVYSGRFNVSLVMLTLVTTLVMNVIGNNIALSLGMVGALSIVRFRTAIKDPRDTAFIFWCIAAGICCGVSEFMIAAIGSAVIFLFLFLFGFVKSNNRYLLVVRGDRTSSRAVKSLMQEQFGKAADMRVQNSTEKDVEFIYEITQKTLSRVNKRNGRGLDEILYEIEGIRTINLVCQNDELSR